MNRFNNLIKVYSLVLLVGGAVGFFVAKSTMSLMMSAGFAILLIGSLYWSRTNQVTGQRAALFLLSLLALFFGWRWHTGKFMPGGMLFLLTCLVLFTACRWAKNSLK